MAFNQAIRFYSNSLCKENNNRHLEIYLIIFIRVLIMKSLYPRKLGNDLSS